MHNLEEQINQWREELTTSQNLQEEIVDELEDHLRQKLDELDEVALSAEDKLALAKVRLGHPSCLGNEFKKLNGYSHQLKQLGYMIGGYLLIDTILKILHVTAKIASSVSFFVTSIATSLSTVYISISILLLAAFFYFLWCMTRTESQLQNTSLVQRLTSLRRRYPQYTIALLVLALTAVTFVNKIGFSILMARYIPLGQLSDFMIRTAIYDMSTTLLTPLFLLAFLAWIIRMNNSIQDKIPK